MTEISAELARKLSTAVEKMPAFPKSVQRILEIYQRTGAGIIVPSFEKHRGHPWLVGREHWDEILGMRAPATMRDFLNKHASQIKYLDVDTPSILADLDTPDDYLKSKP